MAYSEQTLGGLQQASRQASSILMIEAADTFKRPLNERESLIIQAISHVLLDEEVFVEPQIMHLTKLPHGSVSDRLNRYVNAQMIYEKERLGGRGHRGHPKRVFASTEFGDRIFSFFQTQEPPTHP